MRSSIKTHGPRLSTDLLLRDHGRGQLHDRLVVRGPASRKHTGRLPLEVELLVTIEGDDEQQVVVTDTG